MTFSKPKNELFVYVMTKGNILEDVAVFSKDNQDLAYTTRDRTRCELMEVPFDTPPTDEEWEVYSAAEGICVGVWPWLAW
jgi:hypothetical protein